VILDPQPESDQCQNVLITSRGRVIPWPRLPSLVHIHLSVHVLSCIQIDIHSHTLKTHRRLPEAHRYTQSVCTVRNRPHTYCSKERD